MATIPVKVFYGKRKRATESDSHSTGSDFGTTDSDEYVPSGSSSSDSEDDVDTDLTVHSESSNEDEENISLQNNWGTVNGSSMKMFPFTVSTAALVEKADSNAIKPINYYNKMVTEVVFQLLVDQTNLNAKKKLTNKRVSRRSRLKT